MDYSAIINDIMVKYSEDELNKIIDRLIFILCNENKQLNFETYNLDKKTYTQKRQIFHSLFITRKPAPLSSEFLKLQNELLSYENNNKNLVDVNDFTYKKNMTIFVGDIKTLKVDAIVISCDGDLVGRFDPERKSISTDIIATGGLQIRQELSYIISKQSKDEPCGSSKIVRGYNLPSSYVIFTVSPRITLGRIGYKEKENLINCYKSSLELARSKGLKSIAFSCLSTGGRKYLKKLASEIAVSTVSHWLEVNNYPLNVIFCMNNEENLEHYRVNFIDYDIK